MSEIKAGIKQPGRVTILDIAKAANVSKSSVSRFLDERLPPSNSEAAKRVRRIAGDLGYVRDVSAASLRRGTTGLIGVIVPRLTDTVMAMLYESLQRAAARSGYFAIVATTEDTPEAGQIAATTLLKRGVDGLVLSTARLDDTFIASLREQGVPHVLALRTDGKSPSSIGDDGLGGYLATRHLLDLGHKRIGIIAGPSYASSACGRVDGFRRAMAEAGLEVNPAYVIESSFSIDSGDNVARKLMALALPPTAIFAVNDNTAIGAVSALGDMGLSIPDDVSVVGYNDVPIVSRLPVPLTSVHVPFDQVAIEALDLLLSKEQPTGDPLRKSLPTLMPRRSTGAIKTHMQTT